jgi:hypothetical protein
MKLTSFIALVAIGAIGLVGIDRYKAHVAKVEATPIAAPTLRAQQPEPVATPVEDRSWIKPRDNAPTANAAAPAASRCDGRTHCSHMRSCEEAKYFIQHCPNTQMDGDRDGVPCEEQWC